MAKGKALQSSVGGHLGGGQAGNAGAHDHDVVDAALVASPCSTATGPGLLRRSGLGGLNSDPRPALRRTSLALLVGRQAQSIVRTPATVGNVATCSACRAAGRSLHCRGGHGCARGVDRR